MKLKDLNCVIDGNAYLNIITESRHWLFTSDLLERTDKEIEIIRNELFIVLEG